MKIKVMLSVMALIGAMFTTSSVYAACEGKKQAFIDAECELREACDVYEAAFIQFMEADPDNEEEMDEASVDYLLAAILKDVAETARDGALNAYLTCCEANNNSDFPCEIPVVAC